MNFTELTQLENFKSTSSFATLNFKKGQHCSRFYGDISCFFEGKAQIKKQINHLKNNGCDNLLMNGQWNNVEAFLNKHGFKGEYVLTKSKTFCRLTNINDYIKALESELINQ